MENTYKDIDFLREKLNKLRKQQSEKVAKAFDIEYTYESNKIEGNTLTLKETALVIEKGLTISNKPLREHLEAINHQYAIDFIKKIASNKEPITERTILAIHQLILQGIDNENAGKYRAVQVLISGSLHIPPQAIFVKEKMEEIMRWYETNKRKKHPVELSAEMHERLVTIHPFIDGNGRTARLLMNLILLQNEYPIAILKGDTKSRLKYYDVLEEAQTTGNKLSFIHFIAENIKETLHRIIKIVE